MKLKFEEAISVPESEKRSVADSIDYHTIGVFLLIYTTLVIIYADFILKSYLRKFNSLQPFSCYLISTGYIITDYISFWSILLFVAL